MLNKVLVVHVQDQNTWKAAKEFISLLQELNTWTIQYTAIVSLGMCLNLSSGLKCFPIAYLSLVQSRLETKHCYCYSHFWIEQTYARNGCPLYA